MTTSYCISYKGFFQEVKVTTHPSPELAKACGDDTGGADWSALVVSSEVDVDLGGPGLIAIYNALALDSAPVGEEVRKVEKFESKGVGKKRVFAILEQRYLSQPHETAEAAPSEGSSVAAEPTAGGESQASESEGEDMSKKKKVRVRVKKEPGERKPRGKGKPAGKVSELRPVREGTDRQKVLKLMNGSNTAEQIASEIGDKMTAKKVGTIVFCMSRDNGIGYEFGVKGQLKAVYPGDKAYKDAVKKTPAE
jgi:hypothetical protein